MTDDHWLSSLNLNFMAAVRTTRAALPFLAQRGVAPLSPRFTRPDELADLVLFLASNRSGNITGADFVIDGGLIKTL